MQSTAAELFSCDDFTGCGLHQRRAAQEDCALFVDDDRFVSHRRNVGTTGGTGAHDGGQLRNAGSGQGRLVVEDAAEVLTVREDIVLVGQVGAAGVHQVDAGKLVFARNFLGAQVLLDGHRVVGSALDRGVVGDDHAGAAGNHADAGDDSRTRAVVVVHAVGR